MGRIRKSLPTSGDRHVNRPLATLSIAWIQDQTKYIAARVFPIVNTKQRGNQYTEYDRADFLRDQAEERANGTPAAVGGFRISRSTFFCRRYDFAYIVTDEDRTEADDEQNPDEEAMEFVTQQLLTRREALWHTDHFVGGVWGTTFTPATLWDAGVTGDPHGDIATAMSTVEGATGFRPNFILAGQPVWEQLSQHPDILDRIKYTQGPAIIATSLLAQLFEVDEFMVSRAVVNSGAEEGTEATAFIAGKHVLVGYRQPSPGLRRPSLGYTFNWTGLFSGAAEGPRIKKFRDEKVEGDIIEAAFAFDQKLVAAELGYFFLDVVA